MLGPSTLLLSLLLSTPNVLTKSQDGDVVLAPTACEGVSSSPKTDMWLFLIADQPDRDRALLAAAKEQPDSLTAVEQHDAGILLLRETPQTAGARLEACHLFQASAKRGVDIAYASLGELILATAKGRQQQAVAGLSLQRAAGKGNRLAALRVAEMTATGQGAYPADPKDAFDTAESLEQEGEPYADLTVGEFYALGVGVERDGQKARFHFEAAAQHDIPEAEEALGWLYQNGSIGLMPDIPVALRWYEQAFGHGRTRLAITIGQLYQSERNPHADPTEAIAWFERADAEEKSTAKAETARTLAFMQPSAGRDLVRACRLATEAANTGDRTGEFVLYLLIDEKTGCRSDKSALEWLDRSLAAGSDEAGLAMARRLMSGYGMPRDIVRAKTLLDHVIADGLVAAYCSRAMVELNGSDDGLKKAIPWMMLSVYSGWHECDGRLGLLIVGGRVDKVKDPLVGVNLIEKSAAKGDVLSEAGLGALFSTGSIIPRDDIQAVFWFSKAAAAKNPAALLNMGRYYQNGGGGLVRDPAKAAGYYEQVLALGNPDKSTEVLLYLAEILERGEGVPSDAAKALALRQQAAAMGSTTAMTVLSIGYREGRYGLPVDQVKAFSLSQAAASQGDPWGMYQLGDFYRLGLGTGRDELEAFRWYQRAADKGNIGARNAIGLAYLDGMGGYPRDAVKAEANFQQAAASGNANALMSLAILYSGSTLGKPDLVKALAYIRLAIERAGKDLDASHLETARDLRDKLRGQLSDNDLENADRLVVTIAQKIPKKPELQSQ